MRKLILILFLFGLLTSCSKDNPQFVELNGKFIYEDPNCDNGGNPEIDCTNFVDFISNSQAVIHLYGDVLYTLNYELKENKIDFTFENGEIFDLSFIVQNNTTLLRPDYNQTWRRE